MKEVLEKFSEIFVPRIWRIIIALHWEQRVPVKTTTFLDEIWNEILINVVSESSSSLNKHNKSCHKRKVWLLFLFLRITQYACRDGIIEIYLHRTKKHWRSREERNKLQRLLFSYKLETPNEIMWVFELGKMNFE